MSKQHGDRHVWRPKSPTDHAVVSAQRSRHFGRQLEACDVDGCNCVRLGDKHKRTYLDLLIQRYILLALFLSPICAVVWLLASRFFGV